MKSTISCLFLSLFTLATSCLGSRITGITNCDVVTGRTCSQFAKIMAQEGLSVAGFGGSHKNGLNSIIEMNFKTEQFLNQSNARQLILEYSDKFLAYLNNSKDLQPYLIEYPFNFKNIEIAIFGKSEMNQDPSVINIVSMLKGSIYYFVKDPDSQVLVVKMKETLEEAERILREEKSCL